MEHSILNRLPYDLVQLIFVVYCTEAEWLSLSRVSSGLRKTVGKGLEKIAGVGLDGDTIWGWCWWVGGGWRTISDREYLLADNEATLDGPEAEPGAAVSGHSYLIQGTLNVGFTKRNKVHCYAAGYGERITHHHSRPYGLILTTENSLIKVVLIKSWQERTYDGPKNILSVYLTDPGGGFMLLTRTAEVYRDLEVVSGSGFARFMAPERLVLGAITSTHAVGCSSSSVYLWDHHQNAVVWSAPTAPVHVSLASFTLLVTSSGTTTIYIIPPHGVPPTELLSTPNPSSDPLAIDEAALTQPSKRKHLKLLSTSAVGETRCGPVHKAAYRNVTLKR